MACHSEMTKVDHANWCIMHVSIYRKRGLHLAIYLLMSFPLSLASIRFSLSLIKTRWLKIFCALPDEWWLSVTFSSTYCLLTSKQVPEYLPLKKKEKEKKKQMKSPWRDLSFFFSFAKKVQNMFFAIQYRPPGKLSHSLSIQKKETTNQSTLTKATRTKRNKHFSISVSLHTVLCELFWAVYGPPR